MISTVDLSLICTTKCEDYLGTAEKQDALLSNNSVKTLTAIKKNVEKDCRKVFDPTDIELDGVIKVGNLHKLARLQHNGWNYKNFCKMNEKLNCNKVSFFKKTIVQEKNDASKKNLSSIEPSVNNEERLLPVPKRTKDQENAIRRIEDVHNYAKIFDVSAASSSAESNCSSSHNDDEREDNNDDETENLKYLNYANFKNNLNTMMVNNNEEDFHIDVETLSKEDEMFISNDLKQENVLLETDAPPEHHARRPMNAFLIFCKRHRSIVKDRYKSLENRAITKILGDWWASLETNEKKCFTNLAQQNKDAFFSANPNFKWYKLPAPPLRNLQVRTNLSEIESRRNDNLTKEACQNNYFKLADETQMGDLNTLLVDDKKNVFEEKVGRQDTFRKTKQMCNHHIVKTKSSVKRRLKCNLKTEQEQEILQRQTSRPCKGKIYQELVHSGQITTIIKRSRGNFTSKDVNNDYQEKNPEKTLSHTTSDQLNDATAMNEICANSTKMFDLEEKIKELPALNLDVYLQQKKNVKKKRKINVNKRCSPKAARLQLFKSNEIKAHNDGSESLTNINNSPEGTGISVAVGSQKRKARKESITRRDISAVDNEVTAVLTIDNKNCPSSNEKYCLYDESSLCLFGSTSTSTADRYCTTFNANKATSLTSDLLILAEVAVKCSEPNQNE